MANICIPCASVTKLLDSGVFGSDYAGQTATLIHNKLVTYSCVDNPECVTA